MDTSKNREEVNGCWRKGRMRDGGWWLLHGRSAQPEVWVKLVALHNAGTWLSERRLRIVDAPAARIEVLAFRIASEIFWNHLHLKFLLKDLPVGLRSIV